MEAKQEDASSSSSGSGNGRKETLGQDRNETSNRQKQMLSDEKAKSNKLGETLTASSVDGNLNTVTFIGCFSNMWFRSNDSGDEIYCGDVKKPATLAPVPV